MCGRTCLTLSPDEVKCACSYLSRPNESSEKQPEWREEFNLGKKYTPSHNIAPTDITPVLVSAKHFDETNNGGDRILVPMMWGLIPPWHKGDYRKHGLTTNNCRLENLQQSKLYSKPFQIGQRCVIICEGFYEWQTTTNQNASNRPAFYIYMPQKPHIKIENRETWPQSADVQLLRVAGLFDFWTNEDGDRIYSYTVITFESNKKMSWMHHRMPAILETDKQVSDWLDFDRVRPQQALTLLKPAVNIIWHRVSNLVNNSRNKSDQCNKALTDIKPPKKNSLMESWLVKKKRKSTEDEDDQANRLAGAEEADKKRIKLEEEETK